MRPRVLIAGGYGLVGGWIAKHLRDSGAPVDLILAGRNPDRGAALADELGASLLRLDVTAASDGLLQAGPVDLVVAALQDPGDLLLIAALGSGAAYLGIVGTADGVASTMIAAVNAGARRPALVLGHWQAGALVAAAEVVSRSFASIERVELSALYDYADPIGPMTAGDAEGFFGRATLRRDGAWIRVEAQGEARRVERRGGPAFDAQPMGVLDVFSLAFITDAPDIRFDLGTGQSLGTLSGAAASHDLYIDLEGVTSAGEHAHRRWRLTDPKGQAHLTALGVLVGVERLLGLDGAPPPPGGLAFPETLLDGDRTLARLRAFGVQFEAEAAP